MSLTEFFLDDRANLLAGLLALGLFAAGALAVSQRQGVAGVFLVLAGFVVLMYLEYKHIDPP